MLDKSISSRERSPEAKRQAAYRKRLEQRQIHLVSKVEESAALVERLRAENSQLLDERVRLLSALDLANKEVKLLQHKNAELQAELDELDRLLNE
jgi:hypothetical protein